MIELIVDEVDVYAEFGVYITEGGLNGLVSFPPLKEPEKVSWAERDGIEVDLSNPKLDAKKFSIDFGVTGNGDYNAFLALILVEGYHIFTFTSLGITKVLRVVTLPDLSVDLITTFKVEFSEDNPARQFASVGTGNNTGYKFDDKDLSAYGIAILQGSDDSILKLPDLKSNLAIESKFKNGVMYDVGRVRYGEKQVQLKCLALASATPIFINNMNALLYDLTAPGEHEFAFKNLKYTCYYKSMSVTNFDYSGRIWCEFTLNLIFTKLGV